MEVTPLKRSSGRWILAFLALLSVGTAALYGWMFSHPILAAIDKRLPQVQTMPALMMEDGSAVDYAELKARENTLKLGNTVTNRFGMRFTWLPAGTFDMGTPLQGQWPKIFERQHRVQLTRGFFMGVTTVTQAQWIAVMKENPSYYRGDELPVEQVSLDDCLNLYLPKLREQDACGVPYRIPTEAEWEYACRAGANTDYSFGDNVKLFDEYAWYSENAGGRTHPVAKKRPNAWGLYDMHGNVKQWCMDWYDENYYAKSPLEDPIRKEMGVDQRVVRGCSWYDPENRGRSAERAWAKSVARLSNIGVRVCFRLD
jgi:formylglycine-generating enzyme required for sulfatase activity